MIKPTRGNYLCELIPDTRRTESGLFIAETVKEKPHRAKVILCGGNNLDGYGKEIKQSAKIGDIIHFKRVWNREIPKDKTMIFIKESEIVAIE